MAVLVLSENYGEQHKTPPQNLEGQVNAESQSQDLLGGECPLARGKKLQGGSWRLGEPSQFHRFCFQELHQVLTAKTLVIALPGWEDWEGNHCTIHLKCSL